MGKMGFTATQNSEDDGEIPVTSTSIIECTVCGEKMWYKNYGSHNAADACECKNLKIGMLPADQPARFEAYLTVRYEKEPPKIYEVPIEEYQEYLENKDNSPS